MLLSFCWGIVGLFLCTFTAYVEPSKKIVKCTKFVYYCLRDSRFFGVDCRNALKEEKFSVTIIEQQQIYY